MALWVTTVTVMPRRLDWTLRAVRFGFRRTFVQCRRFVRDAMMSKRVTGPIRFLTPHRRPRNSRTPPFDAFASAKDRNRQKSIFFLFPNFCFLCEIDVIMYVFTFESYS